VGEAFLQRLLRAGRYDVARRVANLFAQQAGDPRVREHFGSRLSRVDMLGKPAPAIAAGDVDGHPVNLADLKGKVVLVDFWATYAPPCMAELPHYNALYSQYRSKGLEVVGVNLDAMRQGLRKDDIGRVQHALRQLLIAYRIGFPVVVNGTGANDFARAYGVTDIPANFLIDRDGKIIHIEMMGPELDKAVAEALGEKKGDSDTAAARR
jgi:peroxiredoxin